MLPATSGGPSLRRRPPAGGVTCPWVPGSGRPIAAWPGELACQLLLRRIRPRLYGHRAGAANA